MLHGPRPASFRNFMLIKCQDPVILRTGFRHRWPGDAIGGISSTLSWTKGSARTFDQLYVILRPRRRMPLPKSDFERGGKGLIPRTPDPRPLDPVERIMRLPRSTIADGRTWRKLIGDGHQVKGKGLPWALTFPDRFRLAGAPISTDIS